MNQSELEEAFKQAWAAANSGDSLSRLAIQKAHYGQALEIAEELHSMDATNGVYRWYAFCSYSAMGGVLLTAEKWEDAREFFFLARDLINEAPLNSMTESKTRLGMTLAFKNIGKTYAGQGDFKNGVQYFKDGLQCGNELFPELENNIELIEALHTCHIGLGDIYAAIEESEAAKSEFEKSMLVLRQFEDNGTDTVMLRALCGSLNSYGMISYETGDSEKAFGCFIRIIECAEEIIRRSRAGKYVGLNYLCIGAVRCGDLERLEGRKAEAKKYYLTSLQAGEALMEADPSNIPIFGTVADIRQKIGELCRDLGDSSGAARWFTEAMAARGGTVDKTMPEE